jgi:acetyltransferase-like isoleucine patch superfamily enzyme
VIHPQACIDATVTIGEGAAVWQFASVIRGAKIGRDCSIGSCAVVDGARLGDGCRIGHGAQVHPGVDLGNEVFIGPGAVIANDRWPRVSKEGFDLAALISGPPCVVIENGASVGANATVLPGVRIGRNSMVAAGAVVTGDVPANYLWLRMGGPPMPIGDRERERVRLAC